MVKERLNELADAVIGYTDSDYMRIGLRAGNNSLTRFANSQIHQNIDQELFSVQLELVYGKKHGTASLSVASADELKKAHDKLKNSVLTFPDDDEYVPMPEGGDFDYSDKWDKRTSGMKSAEKAEMVGSIIKEAKKVDALVFGSLNIKKNVYLIANNYGHKGIDRSTYVDLQVIPAHGDNTTYLHTFSHSADDLNIVGLMEDPLKRLSYYDDHGEFGSGEQTVILEPNAAGDMIRFLNFMTFSGKAFNEKQSFVSEKLGENVTGENITISDDHAHPLTIGMPFDSELSRRRQLSLLKDGKAIEIAHDTRSAAKAGTRTTGHALFGTSMPFPLNPVMEGGDNTIEEMIEATESGLLITRFNYTNVVNRKKTMFTGMTRNGIYRIENGKIAGTANNMRFTVNILETLKHVTHLENKQHFIAGGWFGGVVVPALRIEGFNFTGKTRF